MLRPAAGRTLGDGGMGPADSASRGEAKSAPTPVNDGSASGGGWFGVRKSCRTPAYCGVDVGALKRCLMGPMSGVGGCCSPASCWAGAEVEPSGVPWVEDDDGVPVVTCASRDLTGVVADVPPPTPAYGLG